MLVFDIIILLFIYFLEIVVTNFSIMKIFYVFVSNLMVIVPIKMINWSIKLNLSYVIKLK